MKELLYNLSFFTMNSTLKRLLNTFNASLNGVFRNTTKPSFQEVCVGIYGLSTLTFLDDNQKHKSFLMKPNEEFTYNQYTKKVKVDKPYIPTQTSCEGVVI